MKSLQQTILINPLNLKRPESNYQIRASKSHFFRININDITLPCVLCGLSQDNEAHI